MRPALATLIALSCTGCFGPQTAIILPECVKRIEIAGQHSREGERKIILDHTLDLPLSRVQVTHERWEGGKRRFEEIDVVSSRPDLGHLIVGGGFGGVGALLLAFSVSQMVVADRSLIEPQPFYAALLGSSALLTGLAVISTGWHPPSDTILRSSCAEPSGLVEDGPYDR